jgi:gliding motility-associated-like protein
VIKFSFLVTFFALLLGHNSFSQNQAPTITAQGNQMYCSGAPMPIVTSVSITDPDATDTTLDVVYVQISEGYASGQDQLILNGIHPTITASWNVNQGKLELLGPATFNEFTAAIQDVVFQSTQASLSTDKAFSINIGNANYLPSTGHYYFYVSDVGVSWTDAKIAAEGQSYYGLQGYLATLTSPEEGQLAGEQSLGTGWIGANDAETEGTWKWVTGPEAGTVFWIGQSNGTAQNGEYSYWNTGEPNNCCNGEDYAHITDPSIGLPGAWNDLPNDSGTTNPNDPYYPKGYIVEFGGMPGDPVINLSASTKIIAAKIIDLNEVESCGGSLIDLSLTTNTDTVLWYDSETSTTPIHTGFDYQVYLSTSTTFWVLPSSNGCVSGERTPITATINEQPQTNDISIIQCDETGLTDGLTVFNINAYFEDITAGITQDRVVNYFLESTLSTQIDGDAYNNISNPQTIYAQVVNTVSGCDKVAEIELSVSTTASNNALLERCDDDGEEDGLASFDLSLADADILVGLPSDLILSYYETFNDALLETNPLTTTYTNTTPYNQTLFVRAEQANNCYGISELILKVKPIPQLKADEEVYYCLNTFPEAITLDGGVINDIPNNYYYHWSTGETTMQIQVNATGVYTVTVINANGCSKTRTITVLPSNIATIGSIDVEDASNNNRITVLVTGEGTYTYALDNSNGPYQDSNVFEDVPAGIHTVYIKDIKNDCGTVTQDISVIGFPKYFTPNNDGYNDTWQVFGISSQFQSNTKVLIFSRYGKLLSTLSLQSGGWYGTFNGHLMPTDDYWFYVTLEDGRIFKGHFTLKI